MKIQLGRKFWIAATALIILFTVFIVGRNALHALKIKRQINALNLPQQTGWSAETIREAYDQVLDFCVLGAPFGTGELAWSESGRRPRQKSSISSKACLICSGVRPVCSGRDMASMWA